LKGRERQTDIRTSGQTDKSIVDNNDSQLDAEINKDQYVNMTSLAEISKTFLFISHFLTASFNIAISYCSTMDFEVDVVVRASDL